MGDERVTLAKEASGAIPLRNSAKTSYEVTMETVRATFETYEKVMSVTGSVLPADGVPQQRDLLRAIKMILRLEPRDFDNGWAEVLAWAYKNRDGVMGPRFRYRFLDQAKIMAKRDRDTLERFIHLICATMDGQVRGKVISRYDFGRIHRILADAKTVEKLEGYYQQFA